MPDCTTACVESMNRLILPHDVKQVSSVDFSNENSFVKNTNIKENVNSDDKLEIRPNNNDNQQINKVNIQLNPQQEALRIRQKYPQRIPLICIRGVSSKLPPLHRNKYIRN